MGRCPARGGLPRFERQIRDTFAAAREAKLERGVIVIEKRATFSPPARGGPAPPLASPAAWWHLNPVPRRGLHSNRLARDHGSIVRSGYLAAQTVLSHAGPRSQQFLVPDLASQWPARLVSATLGDAK